MPRKAARGSASRVTPREGCFGGMDGFIGAPVNLALLAAWRPRELTQSGLLQATGQPDQ